MLICIAIKVKKCEKERKTWRITTWQQKQTPFSNIYLPCNFGIYSPTYLPSLLPVYQSLTYSLNSFIFSNTYRSTNVLNTKHLFFSFPSSTYRAFQKKKCTSARISILLVERLSCVGIFIDKTWWIFFNCQCGKFRCG